MNAPGGGRTPLTEAQQRGPARHAATNVLAEYT
jgi:hypothetical protein